MIRLVPALAACLCAAGCGRFDFHSQPGGDGGSGSGSDGAVAEHDFPRLGAMSSSVSQDYTQESFRAAAARRAFVIISYYQGWSGQFPAMTLEEVIQDIHARSTIGTKILVYINDFVELPQPIEPTDARQDLYTKLTDEPWWLFTSGTTGTLVRPNGHPELGSINISRFPPHDASNKTWAEVDAAEHYAFTVAGNGTDPATPSLDGWFVANVPSRPAVIGDWDLDGTADVLSDNPVIDLSIQQGGADMAAELRALTPDAIITAGMSGWDEQPGALDQAYQGGTWGSLIGLEGVGFENRNGFDAMMAQYRYSLANTAAPKLCLFQQSKWQAGDYQSMRYGLAAAMMDDGYYAIDDGTTSLVDHALWFDEFDADLGHAIQQPQTTPWENGVYRRDFERGIVLVNPRGNGTQTVDLGGEFHRLDGTQDPVANSGATVTSVTLADRDGLLLLRL